MLRSSEQLQAYLCIPVMTETMHTIFNAVCTVTDQLMLSFFLLHWNEQRTVPSFFVRGDKT
jgi:hypothetical protein